MTSTIQDLIQKMCNKEEGEAYLFADKLAALGTEEVLLALLEVLKSEDMDEAYLAARALSKMENNQMALKPLFEVIHDKKNQNRNGGLVQMLEGFDLTESFVDILRIYLFGNFKASLLAKDYLDSVEFEITPRVLKKAEKHWNHFKNNVNPNSDDFEIKKAEVEQILNEIKELLNEE
ncbi:HEAT repeat domain-containing protein [Shivajiella indica]|uniref:HEAT repeat domain-containing protein n=1 Tax=Shivajiella indica TaxID=872115 RepID=A0ABW5B514_9BACT